MELFLKISVGGIVAVILAVTVRSQNKELALLVTISTCAVLCIAGIDMLKTIKSYLEKMQAAAEIHDGVITPLVKVCVICAISQFCGIFCKDAGEDSIGKIVEISGSIAAVCAMLPLMDLVWEYIAEFLGG